MSESMAVRYCQCRLDGMGAREAARDVGYAGGVPSPSARRLWDAVKKVRQIPECGQWLPEKLEEAEEEVEEIRLLLRASEVVEGV